MKNKNLAGVLAFFFGGIGVHKFYLGKIFQGVIFFLFSWTFIPAIIALVESIVLWSMSEEKFRKKFILNKQYEIPNDYQNMNGQVSKDT